MKPAACISSIKAIALAFAIQVATVIVGLLYLRLWQGHDFALSREDTGGHGAPLLLAAARVLPGHPCAFRPAHVADFTAPHIKDRLKQACW